MTARRGRRVATALAAATLAMAPVVPASARTQQERGLLELTAQTASVPLDGDFTMRLQLAGAPPTAVLGADVHDRVTTRIGFTRSLDAEGLRRRLRQVGPSPVASFAVAEGTLEVRIPLGTGPGELRLGGPGVYPVVVAVRDGDSTIARIVTHLVALDAAPTGGATQPPLDVALVLPIGAEQPVTQPDGTIEIDKVTRDNVAGTAAVLRSHPDVPLTVVPVPETVDALATSAAEGDPAVVASLAGGLATRQISASPYVPVEPESFIDSGVTDELDLQLDRGTAVISQRLGRPDGRTWIADPTTGEDTVSWLRGRGVDQLVVPESSLRPLDERAFPVTLTQTFLIDDVPGMRAAVADRGLAAHAGATGDPVLDAHHLLADLVVLYLDQPGASRGVVVGTGGGWTPSVPFVDTLLRGLSAVPVLAPVTLDQLFADTPTAGARGQTDGRSPPLHRIIDPEPAERLGRFADALDEARADVTTYEAAVEASNPRSEALRSRLLVAGAATLSNAQRARYLSEVSDAVRSELSKVDVPARQTITLTARSGRVPLLVRNRAGYPLSVLVRLRSEKLSFPDELDLELPLTLEQPATRVELRVRARASGSSPLLITLWSPDGRLQLAETRYTVRSTAFSGVGLVLSIGALTFLVAWWARSARRTLAARRAEARRRHPVGIQPGRPGDGPLR